MFGGVIAKLDYEHAVYRKQFPRLANQRGIYIEPRFASEERGARFMFAHFALKRCRISQRDVRWITDDHVEFYIAAGIARRRREITLA